MFDKIFNEMVNIAELKFDAAGLIPAIVQDADTGGVDARVYEPGISCRDGAFR